MENVSCVIPKLDSFAQTNHTSPLRFSNSEEVNALENKRLFCTACHSSVTVNVSQSLPQWDPLASWYADREFLDSPRPEQLITKMYKIDPRAGLLNID